MSHGPEVEALEWLQFSIWTVAAYPLMWTNFRSKSVKGLSFDFLAFSFTGNVNFAIYSIAMYCATCPVTMPDLLGALHGMFVSCFLVSQCLIYERGDQIVSKAIKSTCISLWFSVVVVWIVFLLMGMPNWRQPLSYMGGVKAICSLFKYVPQCYLNFSRKSTKGFNITSILLDLSGGLLGLIVMIIISVETGDAEKEFLSDVPKLLVFMLTLVFDGLLLTQHYVLYRGMEPSAEEGGQEGESEELIISEFDVGSPTLYIFKSIFAQRKKDIPKQKAHHSLPHPEVQRHTLARNTWPNKRS